MNVADPPPGERRKSGLEFIPGQMDLLDLLAEGDRPWVLDAFCGAGGAARGYQDAGFRVLGVDIEPQPNYCGDDFVQGDAIAFIRRHGHRFALRHASPPCLVGRQILAHLALERAA